MEPKILTLEQDRFLKLIGRRKKFTERFYLTGGTALSAFYLHHRYSEDLDFFTEDDVEPLEITSFIRSLKRDLKYRAAEHHRTLNRNLVFLSFPRRVTLKVEFTTFLGSPIEPRRRIQGLEVDSLLDIAVNKAFTIAQNARTRDFIDLYLILERERWKFQDLLKKARAKFDVHVDPIQLGSQLLKVTAIHDYPRMISPLKDSDWQDFFLEEARLLKSKIFTKGRGRRP